MVEKHDLSHYGIRVFENKILRRIFKTKRDENGEWTRLNNEDFYTLYFSPNKIRLIKSRRLVWAGHTARMEELGSVFKLLTNNPTGKTHLGRSRRRWEDNIRKDLK